MTGVMRYSRGDQFEIMIETSTAFGERKFSKGEIIKIVNIAPLSRTTRSGGIGYVVKAHDGIIKRPLPRRFFERYCRKQNKEI